MQNNCRQHICGRGYSLLSLATPLRPRRLSVSKGMGTSTAAGALTLVLVLALLQIFAVSPAVAQTPEAGTDNGLYRLVSIDADDAFLPSVLSILADKSGYNIVTGPQVNQEERISIHLKDTPIEQAMNLVVRAAGLSYEIVGNSFLVARAKDLEGQVGVTSYVLDLQYTDAESVAGMLTSFIDLFNARITVDVIGNKLLLVTSPKIISDIQKVVEKVDVPPLQIILECRMIEALGIDWNRLSSLQTVIVESPVDAFGNRVDPTGATDLTGLDPSQRGRTPNQMPFYPLETRRMGYWSKQVSAFELALDLLLKQGRAEVLANTSIATLNNQAANLQIVDEIPYVARSGGVGGQVQIDRAIVGVKLQVRPKINGDGYITTEIAPELSSIFQFLESSDTQVPWVKRRTTNTTIRVKDGETVIIAGLLGVESSETTYRFPFLGDIPFLGSLFRHSAKLTRKTDLIIQVTPHILGTGYSLSLPPRVMEVQDKFLPNVNGEQGK
jgi:type IV pilus assembly protein PilQ